MPPESPTPIQPITDPSQPLPNTQPLNTPPQTSPNLTPPKKVSHTPIIIGAILTVAVAGIVLFLALNQPSKQGEAKTQTPTPSASPIQNTADISKTPFIAYSGASLTKVNFQYPNDWFVDNFDRANSATKPTATYVISSLNHSQLIDPNRSQFNKVLSLTVAVAPASGVEKYITSGDPLYRNLDRFATKLQSFTIGSVSYDLIGERIDGTKDTNQNNLYSITLNQCHPDKTCAQQIKRTDGTYVSVSIHSEGNGYTSTGNKPIPMDITSSDYAKILKILSTITY